MHVTFVSFILLVFSVAMTSCTDDVDPLQAVTELQGEKISQLESLTQEQSSKMTAMDALIKQQAATISGMQTSIQTLTSQMALQTPFVAFDVYYSGTFQAVSDHETMKFDVISLNVGNGYSAHTGMFSAPVSGYYLFHCKVTPYDVGEIYLYLQKEGSGIDSLYAKDDNFMQTGDSVRIVQLSKGERVWLVKDHGENRIHSWVWTKFAGFLLRALP